MKFYMQIIIIQILHRERHIKILLLICIINCEVKAIVVTGNFSFTSSYECYLNILSDTTSEYFELEGENHVINKTNNDVIILVLNLQSLKFFPKNISNVFPNLKSLDFSANDITVLTNSHLSSLPHLKQLYLRHNHISQLENNLFDGLPVLQFVDLDDNNINFIGSNIYMPPNAVLLVYNNECVNTSLWSYDDKMDVSSDLQILCPPPQMQSSQHSLQSTTPLIQLETTISLLATDDDIQIKKLQEKFLQLEIRVAKLEKRILDSEMKEENEVEI